MQRVASSRRNHSKLAVLQEFYWAQGSFRWVHKGIYTEGKRSGQSCIAKVFKSGSVFEESYFRNDIAVVEKVLDIVERFNSSNIINERIILNIPEIWYMIESGEKHLLEPFINDFRKFNSNTGWTNCKTPWSRVMQALSHFSYHCTGGSFVICDLQGGLYENGAILTDPVVLSRDRRFGPTDLGPQGISTFFSTHICNEYCRPNWTKPYKPVQVFVPVSGTTMTMERPPLSDQYKYYT